jgi:hypothetical protein
MVTLNEMFLSLSKKQKESLYDCDCRSDYDNHILDMYNYNQKKRTKTNNPFSLTGDPVQSGQRDPAMPV